jgi:hypothetical protein
MYPWAAVFFCRTAGRPTSGPRTPNRVGSTAGERFDYPDPMSSDGSIILGDLIGKLDMLRVTCAKCGRKGRYNVRQLVKEFGRDGKLTDWLTRTTADCPRRGSIDISDQCGARCPDLSKVL